MCLFVKKKKEKSVAFSISTKKLPTLCFQPRPTPLLLIIITMSTPPLLFQPLLLFGTP